MTQTLWFGIDDVEEIEEASRDDRSVTYNPDETKLCEDWKVYREETQLLKQAMYKAMQIMRPLFDYSEGWEASELLKNALEAATV